MTRQRRGFEVSKTKHTFAKRQREIEKRRKAEEKRARRREKNQKPSPAEETLDEETPNEQDDAQQPKDTTAL